MEAPHAQAPAGAGAEAAPAPPALEPAAAEAREANLHRVAADVSGDAAAAAPQALAPHAAAPAAPPAAPAPSAAPAQHAGERTPHPASLAPNAEGIKRGKRVFKHMPPAFIRKGGQADKPLEVRVRTTILSLRAIDLVHQTFTCQFFLEASWLDAGMLAADGTQARKVDAAASKQASGKLVAHGDAAHYFFTPMLRFANRVDEGGPAFEEFYETGTAMHELRLATSPTQPGLAPAASSRFERVAVVCWRVIGCGVFQCAFDLKAFPFDSQLMYIKLISDWDVADVRLVRNMKAEYRSVVQAQAFLQRNEYELSRVLHMTPAQSDPADSSSGVTRSSLRLELRVRRRPTYWAWNVWLPLFCFTGISLASFAVDMSALSDRLTITISILLTLVAYRFAIMDRLPNVDYLTLLDGYIQLCFLVVFAVTVYAVVMCVRAEQAYERTGADVAMTWQAGQRVALWGTSAAWCAANAAIAPAAAASRLLASTRTESLRWWDESETLLWLGGKPLEAWKPELLTKMHEERRNLQAAIRALLSVSRVVTAAAPTQPHAQSTRPAPREKIPPVRLVSITPSPEGEAPEQSPREALPRAASLLRDGLARLWSGSAREEASPRRSGSGGAGGVSALRQSSGALRRAASIDTFMAASRKLARKLLPESEGRWVLLEFASAQDASHAKLALSEAASSDCAACRARTRATAAAGDEWLEPSAADASTTAWDDAVKKLRAAVHQAEERPACAACHGAPADVLRAAAAAAVVCERALPEYKSLLMQHWRAWHLLWRR